MKLTDAQAVDIGLTPSPGAYTGVPFEQYARWPYLSKSALADFATNPALHRARLDGTIPPKSSTGFAVGSAADALWVESLGLLESGFVVWREGARRGKAWTAFKAEHADKTILTADEETRARGAVDALEAHERACELRSVATPQLSLVWDCPITGLRLKGRPDLPNFDRRTLSDLKTARDVTYRGFDRAITDYNYPWQLYLYAQGLTVLEHGARWEQHLHDWRPWLIAVKNEPVHSVSCRPLHKEAIELARVEVSTQLWQYRECVLGGDWPANYDDEREYMPPQWRMKRAYQHENK